MGDAHEGWSKGALTLVSISSGKAHCIVEAKCYLPSLRIFHSDSGSTTGHGKARR
jgi:hypothetical protein